METRIDWRGRVKGSTRYQDDGKPSPKINKTHRMTEKAHEWLILNRNIVEQLARQNYEIQWKL